MSSLPQHVAIIMDGNGRWAKRRLMPRAMGHQAGVKAVRKAISFCVTQHIPVLSLFTLSVENFKSRPSAEVQLLISLLSDSLIKNIDDMQVQQVRVRVIGDLSVFPEKVYNQIKETERLTKNNTGL